MARSAVLAGRTLSDLIRNGFVIGLMVVMGFLLGFRYQSDPVRFVAGLAVAMVFSFALSWIMATIGLAVKSPEAAQSAVFLPVFPLVFASSVFVPTDTMPSWLQGFAVNQPITVTVNALRGLMLGREALADFQPGMSSSQLADAVANASTVQGQVLLSLFWSIAIMAVFVPLAIRVYRKTVT